MEKYLENSINRLAASFVPIMHFFHHLAGEVSKVGQFTLPQYRVLMLVYHENSISVKELRTKLNIAQSSASEIVERLAQQNLIRREKSKTDRRITLLKLTKKSNDLLRQKMSSMREVYRNVLEPLTSEEQDELVEAFETILRLVPYDRMFNVEKIKTIARNL